MLMRPEYTHQPELPRCSSNAGQRPPILVLGDHVRDALLPEFAKQFREKSDHSIVTATSMCVADGGTEPKYGGATRAWARMESEYSAVCLGLIATTRSSIAAACHIIMQGWADGNLPGAVGFLGYSAEFQDTCLRLSHNSRLHGAFTKPSAECAPSVWPPTMILLPADDPALADCASGCRGLRSAGIPVQLEIVGSMGDLLSPALRNARISEIVGELGGFFDLNLAPYFPKRL